MSATMRSFHYAGKHQLADSQVITQVMLLIVFTTPNATQTMACHVIGNTTRALESKDLTMLIELSRDKVLWNKVMNEVVLLKAMLF